MKPTQYIKQATVVELGEVRYNQLRQALKQQGHRISPLMGEYQWPTSDGVNYKLNLDLLCLFLSSAGDLIWGELTPNDPHSNECTLDQILAFIEHDSIEQQAMEQMTIKEVQSKIASLEQQLAITGDLYRQQHQELTDWRNRIDQLTRGIK